MRGGGIHRRGVRGIRLDEGQRLIALMIPKPEGRVLTVSENGYGKRTAIDEFPVKGRGTLGVIGMQTSERNGQLVGAIQVSAGDQMMLISDQGTLVRCRTDEVSELGRNTQGVRVIRLKEGETLVNIARIEDTDEEESDAVVDTSANDTPSDSSEEH